MKPRRAPAKIEGYLTLTMGSLAFLCGVLLLIGIFIPDNRASDFILNFFHLPIDSALGLIFCGAGLITLCLNLFIPTFSCGILACVISLTTFIEYATGDCLMIHRWLSTIPFIHTSLHHVQNVPTNALSFLLIGIALMIIAKQKNLKHEPTSTGQLLLQNILGALVIAQGVTIYFANLFSLEDIYHWAWGTPMAFSSAIIPIILGIGIVSFSQRKDNLYTPLILALVIGIIVSLLSYVALSRTEEQKMTERFKHSAYDRFSALYKEFESDANLVQHLWAFYESSWSVEKDEFYRFTKSILENGLREHALIWAPRITHAGRADFEKKTRELLHTGNRITEYDLNNNLTTAKDREEYFPIQYLSPFQSYNQFLGFNLASDPSIQEAMIQSQKKGDLAATQKILLDKKNALEPYVFLIVKPVYEKTPEKSSTQKRTLSGFVIGIFKFSDIFENVFSHLSTEKIDVYLFDKSMPRGRRLIYKRCPLSQKKRTKPLSEEDLYHLQGLYDLRTFKVADRYWLLLSIPTPDSLASKKTWLPWTALFAFSYISLLLAYFFWVSIRRTAVIEKAVRTRTEQLSLTNEILERQFAERKQAEEKLKELSHAMQNAVEGIAHLDSRDRYLSVNKAYANLLGYDTEEMIGIPIDAIIDPNDIEKFKKIHQAMESKGKGEGDLRAVKKNGIPFFKSIVLVKETEDALNKNYYCFMKDVSERKQQEALEIKSEMLAMVSHELRSPLHSMREGINIVLDGLTGPVSEEQHDALTTAKRSADRLARLVNNVLDYHKLEAGILELEMQENDLNDVVREISKAIQPLAQSKNLFIELHLDLHLPKIAFNWDRITQVLMNLMDNAIKFTECGQIVISTAKKGNNAEIAVKDSGIGIPTEEIPKLFTKFKQLESGRGTAPRGTGLGLAISKMIIEQHFGTIRIENNPEGGSIFIITLPFKNSASSL